MDDDDRAVIVSKIRELDPDNEVCIVNLADNEIEYDDRITCHRKITELKDEEIVRAYYLARLHHDKEYPVEKFELEDKYKVGSRGKQTRVRTDIRVNKNSHSFLLFELKTPSSYEKEETGDIDYQLFKPAAVMDPKAKNLKWLAYCTVDVNADGEIEELKKIIDYERFRDIEDWEDEGRISYKAIPKGYGEKIQQQFIKGGTDAYTSVHGEEPDFIALELKPSIPQDKLQNIRSILHNTLWAGGKKDANKIFFNLVKLILAKVYDEKETARGDPYKFQVVYGEDGKEDLEQTTENVEELYEKALEDPEYLGVDEEELQRLKKREGAIDIIEFEEFEIAYILEQFQEYELTQSDYDFLGQFFESIIREEFKQDKGQFFTHKYLVDFILHATELDQLSLDLLEEETRLPYINDPSVGSGTFLIQAMKLMRKTVNENRDELENKSRRLKEFITSNFPDSKKMVWAKDYLYATEFSPPLAVTTKVNMILHGDGHVHTYLDDALADLAMFEAKMGTKKDSNVYPAPVNEEFDLIISNPPFSTELDPRTEEQLDDLYMYGRKSESENLFIERWYQLLREGGRLGVVLPESVFDTTDNMHIRLFLYKYFWIKAIVSLPGDDKNPFEPFTSTKTCLLFAQKKTAKEVKEWQEKWDEKVEEFREHRGELEDLLSEENYKLDEEDKEDRKEELIKKLKTVFKENYDERHGELSLEELTKKYRELLGEKKLKEWWAFSETSKFFTENYPLKTEYPIFHVTDVGFKRTKRGERERPNQLFQTQEGEQGTQISIDTDDPEKVLDIIRDEVEWQ